MDLSADALENALRQRAGLPLYSGDFIAEYIFPLLYPDSLTRTMQYALGTIAFVVNAAVYWAVVRASRQRRPATDNPADASTPR